MSKDAYYFSHDSNAHKDPRTLKLRAIHGWKGYGVYWAVIETLREQSDYVWSSDDIELISYSISGGDESITEIVKTLIEVGLLVDDGEHIYSESLLRRMAKANEKREKLAEAGRRGGIAKASLKQGQSKSVAIKGKERKLKKGKETNEPPITLSETVEYFTDNGYRSDIAKSAYHHYADNDWKDANDRPVKNIKNKFRSVWFRDEHLIKESGKITPISDLIDNRTY